MLRFEVRPFFQPRTWNLEHRTANRCTAARLSQRRDGDNGIRGRRVRALPLRCGGSISRMPELEGRMRPDAVGQRRQASRRISSGACPSAMAAPLGAPEEILFPPIATGSIRIMTYLRGATAGRWTAPPAGSARGPAISDCCRPPRAINTSEFVSPYSSGEPQPPASVWVSRR